MKYNQKKQLLKQLETQRKIVLKANTKLNDYRKANEFEIIKNEQRYNKLEEVFNSEFELYCNLLLEVFSMIRNYPASRARGFLMGNKLLNISTKDLQTLITTTHGLASQYGKSEKTITRDFKAFFEDDYVYDINYNEFSINKQNLRQLFFLEQELKMCNKILSELFKVSDTEKTFSLTLTPVKLTIIPDSLIDFSNLVNEHKEFCERAINSMNTYIESIEQNLLKKIFECYFQKNLSVKEAIAYLANRGYSISLTESELKHYQREIDKYLKRHAK